MRILEAAARARSSNWPSGCGTLTTMSSGMLGGGAGPALPTHCEQIRPSLAPLQLDCETLLDLGVSHVALEGP